MVKSVAVRTLTPAARLSERFVEPLRRAWAHARLAAGTSQPVDSSVVILAVPEIHGSARIRVGHNLFLYRELYLETQEDGAISLVTTWWSLAECISSRSPESISKLE